MAAQQTLMCLVRSKNRRCFCPIGNRLLSVSSCQRREVFTVLDHILGWDPPDPCWPNVVPMYIEPKKSQRYISKFVSHHWAPLWSLQNIGDIADLSSVEPIVHPSKYTFQWRESQRVAITCCNCICLPMCVSLCTIWMQVSVSVWMRVCVCHCHCISAYCVCVCTCMCVYLYARACVCVCVLHLPITDHIIQLHSSCTFVLHCILPSAHNPAIPRWNQ